MVVVGVPIAHQWVFNARHARAGNLDFVDVLNPVRVGHFVHELDRDVAVIEVGSGIGHKSAGGKHDAVTARPRGPVEGVPSQDGYVALVVGAAFRNGEVTFHFHQRGGERLEVIGLNAFVAQLDVVLARVVGRQNTGLVVVITHQDAAFVPAPNGHHSAGRHVAFKLLGGAVRTVAGHGVARHAKASDSQDGEDRYNDHQLNQTEAATVVQHGVLYVSVSLRGSLQQASM